MRALCYALWLALVFTSGWPASGMVHAQPSAASRPAKVVLLQHGCTRATYESVALVKLLRVELQALGVEELELRDGVRDDELSGSDVAVVELRCDSGSTEGNISVELADLVTRQRVLRDLVVSDLELEARPRALSLAVALLVESAWLQVATAPTPAPQLPESVRTALRRRLAQRLKEKEPVAVPEPASAGLLFATARTFPARGTAVLGGELAYLLVAGVARVSFHAELLIGNQEISDRAGVIAHMQLLWLNAGLSVLWASNTSPELLIGPFGRIGYGGAAASQIREGIDYKGASAPTAALGMTALLRAPATNSVDIWLGLDVGYVTSGVLFLTDQNRSAGLADVTAALRTGLSLKL